jgi:hypothetical protein
MLNTVELDTDPELAIAHVNAREGILELVHHHDLGVRLG